MQVFTFLRLRDTQVAWGGGGVTGSNMSSRPPELSDGQTETRLVEPASSGSPSSCDVLMPDFDLDQLKSQIWGIKDLK